MKTSILIVASLIGLLSCNDTNALLSSTPCYFPDAPDVLAPGWICQQSSSSQLLTAVGVARSSTAGLTFTKKMAIANAQVKLAQRLKGQCGVRNVSEAMLIQSKILNLQSSPNGAQYIQIGLRPSDLKLDCR